MTLNSTLSNPMKHFPPPSPSRLLAACCTLAAASLFASSHREAPGITSTPKLDCSDFYFFNSYESGRADYVTAIANYIPLQDAYGGPNYFSPATTFEGRYEIHFDNTADAREDLTFQFRFTRTTKDIALPIGPSGSQKQTAVPLITVGPLSAGNTASLNVEESFAIDLITGDRRTGAITVISNAVTGAAALHRWRLGERHHVQRQVPLPPAAFGGVTQRSDPEHYPSIGGPGGGAVSSDLGLVRHGFEGTERLRSRCGRWFLPAPVGRTGEV